MKPYMSVIVSRNKSISKWEESSFKVSVLSQRYQNWSENAASTAAGRATCGRHKQHAMGIIQQLLSLLADVANQSGVERIYCHKNITIYRCIAKMSQGWKNVRLKLIKTWLAVNWHLCLVSHDQITSFCQYINHQKDAVWLHRANQKLCYTQLCIPHTKCIDILKFISIHVLTSHVLQCINALIYHPISKAGVTIYVPLSLWWNS